MELIDFLLMGALQGITEWLPISSSGQSMLALINLINITPQSALQLAIYLHIGTLLAVIVKFRGEIKNLFKSSEKNLLMFLVVSTIVSALIGLPLYLLMKQYLMGKGIASMRIIMEDKAASTQQNMQFSAAIMNERFPDMERTAAVVTSDFHLYRSLALAEDAGIDAFGVGARTPRAVLIPNYMREYLAVLNTWLFGIEI